MTEQVGRSIVSGQPDNKLAKLEEKPQLVTSCTAALINSGEIHSSSIFAPCIHGDHNQLIYSPETKCPERVRFNQVSHNQSFAGREKILSDLHETITDSKSRGSIVVLNGIGGIGKTETIRNYIKRHDRHYWHTVWINAESHSEMRNCFVELAALCQISYKDFEEKTRKDEFVKEQIYDLLCKKPCLVVFDNAVTRDGNDGIDTFLPKKIDYYDKRPAIVATSRRRDWEDAQLLPMFGLDEDECYELLVAELKLETSENNRAISEKIRSMCEGLPLALQQVIATIRVENKIRTQLGDATYTMSDYMDELNENVEDFIKIPPANSSSVKQSVFEIFQMSFNRLGAKHGEIGKLAVKSLQVAAFLSADRIPRELFYALLNENRKNVAKALSLLDDYNLITTIKGCYKVHRIVQLVTPLIKQGISGAMDGGSEVGTETLTMIVKFFQTFLKNLKPKDEHLYDILENGIRVVNHLRKMSNLGDNVPFVLDLAYALEQHGKYYDAKKLYGYLLEVTDGEIPVQTEAKSGLGCVLRKQGQFKDAQRILEELVDSSKSHADPDNMGTLRAKVNLANVFSDQGRYDKARSMYEEALEDQDTSSHIHNPYVLMAMHNLAVVLHCQGHYDKALELCKEVVLDQKKILVDDHPDVIRSQLNLACIYDAKGMHKEAKEIFQSVLRHQEGSLEPNNPETLNTKLNMALVLSNLREYDQSMKLNQEVLDAVKSLRENDHPRSLLAKHNLAVIKYHQKNFEDARKLFEEVLLGQEKLLGELHVDTIRTKHNLATTFLNQGRNGKALELYKSVLKTQENVLGSQHPETLRTKNNLAITSSAQSSSGYAIGTISGVPIGGIVASNNTDIVRGRISFGMSVVTVKREDVSEHL